MKLDLSDYHSAVDSKSRGLKILNDKPMIIYGLDILIVALYLILFVTTVIYWFNSCSSFLFPLIVLAFLGASGVALLKQTDSDKAMKIRVVSIAALLVLLCLTTMTVSAKTACGMGICSGRDNVQDRIDRVVMKINRKPSQCNILYDEEDDAGYDGRRGRGGEDDNDNNNDNEDRRTRRMNDDRKNVVTQNNNNIQQQQSASVDNMGQNSSQSSQNSINTDKVTFKRENNEGSGREGEDDQQRDHGQNQRNGGGDRDDSGDEDDYSPRQGSAQSHLNVASAFFCRFYDEVYPTNNGSNNNSNNSNNKNGAAPIDSGCSRVIKESIIFKNPELSLLRVLIIAAALILILILADMFILRRNNKINQDQQQENHMNDTPLINLDNQQEQPFEFNNEVSHHQNNTQQIQQQNYQQFNNNNNNQQNNNNHFNI